MSRVYNFSAGPAVLPEEVLKEAAAEMLDYQGCGMSVMEMSHRSSVFQEIIETAEADIRELMHIPDNYKVLFLQGGASQQFAMIPMNLIRNEDIPKLACYADKEANPLYPVPALWGPEKLEQMYHLVQEVSEHDRNRNSEHPGKAA